MKMTLSPEQQVKTSTTTEQDAPLKHSVQSAGSKTGMKLSELLRGAEATLPGSAEHIHIQQVTCDSRKAEKGALFFALHGAKADGNAFIEDAVKRGAAAIASEEPAPEKLSSRVAWVQVRDARKALATT